MRGSGQERPQLRRHIDNAAQEVLEQKLWPQRDRDGALAHTRSRPFLQIETCGLGVHQQAWAVEPQRLRPTYFHRQIAAKLEVKLDESIPRKYLHARMLVGEIQDDDVDILADLSEIPIPLTFLGFD